MNAPMFDEGALEADIAHTWGFYGAHMEVFHDLQRSRTELLAALQNSVSIMKMAQMVEQMRGMKEAAGWDKPIAYAEAAIAKATGDRP